MANLSGKRVLIVEDEALIAFMVADMLTEAGATVIGPAVNIEQGLDLAANAAIDVATLDVNVRGERIDPVAEALDRRGVPYLLASGYTERPPNLRPSVIILNKPYVESVLIGSLVSLLASGGGSGSAGGMASTAQLR